MKGKLTILALASLWAVTACEEIYAPPPPPRWPDLTSPANVLETVETSFNERNINYLKKSLGPEFVFYVDPRDVGREPPPNSPPTPSSWNYESFCQTVLNMFNEAYSINLAITTRGVGEPEPEEKTYIAANVELKLLVMVDEKNGYVADQGYCNFQFEAYPTEERKRNWRLTSVWDRTSVPDGKSNGVTRASVSRILALYQ
jgi:hypothetical protein